MKKILYVIEDTNSAQFRYRVKNIAEVLHGQRYSVEWISKFKLDEIDLKKYDLIVILRQTDKDGVISNFIKSAHSNRRKVLFDLDDLIFDYADLPILMSATNGKNIFYWIGYFWGIRRIAKKVDGFICTNEFLAKKIRRSFSKPVKVIRNSINKEQIEISKKLIEEKNIDRKKGFIIGYFSGSPTHVRDFRMAESELLNFLNRHEDARLEVVGYMNFSGRMKKKIDEGRIRVKNFVDYLELQKMISKVDVNIAPLLVNDFTNCKSELKFFEAAIVGTTTIASPTYAFKKVIENGKNGFLAKPDEWCDILENLYRCVGTNRKVAEKAKSYAMKHFYGKEFLEEVEATYDFFIK